MLKGLETGFMKESFVFEVKAEDNVLVCFSLAEPVGLPDLVQTFVQKKCYVSFTSLALCTPQNT